MIVFSANTRKATATTDDAITTRSVGIPVSLVLSSEFDGLAKTLCAKNGRAAVDVVLVGDAVNAVLPPDVLLTTGQLQIGIYAADDEGNIVIPTVWALVGQVKQGAMPSGVDPLAPSPSWVAQVQNIASEAIQNSEQAIETANEAKEVAITAQDSAQASASAAAQSATDAGNSADAAAGSATDASESADAAAGSASTASTKAGEAAASATTASGAAATATTQAGNASDSAAAAAQSASEAEASAEAASTKAGEASASATAAAGSASTASQKASEAAQNATQAANSATSASASATAAGTAQTGAETAKTAAETAAQSVSASADQIAQNAADIIDLKSAVNKYDDLLYVIKITDPTTTMGDVSARLAEVNTAGDHVVFDVAALGAGMYLATIYINQGYYRIADLVTGFEGTGFYTSTDLLRDVIKSGSQSSGKHYTVRWDRTNAQMVRLNDAASITTDTANFVHSGAVNENYDNPFDEIYPWSERKLCNIDMDAYRNLAEGESIEDCVSAWEEDADFSYSDANGVWVYTPPFYGRSFSLGNYVYFDVTDENTLNNIFYPAQITGRWHGVPVSLTVDGAEKKCLIPSPGMPAKRVAISTIKSYANNWGASLVSIYELDASLLLFLVEFADYNAQIAVGNGVSWLYRQSSDHIAASATNSSVVQVVNNSANVGVCIPGAIFDIGTANGGNQVGSYIIQSVAPDSVDSSLLNVTLDRATTVTTDNFWSVNGLSNVSDEAIGSKSGYIGANGKSNAYYRGEVLWGNMWQYILGAYHQANTNLIWIAEDANDADNYNAINTAKHINTGIAIGATNGYIQSLAFPEERLSAPAFCTAVGGSSTAPVGDYFYNVQASNTILLVGGYANYGTAAGPFFWFWSYWSGASVWYCGGRPRLKSP